MVNPLILPQIANSIMPGDQTMPEPPQMPQKRRGLFGGKVDMEDFQMALARAAAYFEGDYEGAAAITGHMGKARQGRLDAAQLATALASDTSLTAEQKQYFGNFPEKYAEWKIGQMKPPELPTSVQEANWLNDPRRTPDELQAYYRAKGPTLVVSNGNTQAYNRDGTPYGGAAPVAPVGKLTPLPEGGGGSDVTGNFRSPIPRR